MRRILNLFITGLTLALATVSLWLVTIIIYVISLLFMAGGLIFESCSWAILGLFIMAAAKILALYAIDSWVPGLSIAGDNHSDI